MDDEQQQKTINGLYLGLILASILSFVPFTLPQIFAVILLLVVLVAAYIYRLSVGKDTLLHNHMTYMIGTIWIGTTFLVIGMAIAGVWVYQYGDHTVVHNTMLQMQSGMIPTESQIYGLIDEYMRSNMALVINAALIFVGPGILYFVYRIAKGYSRAMRGYRMANPRSWL